MSQCSQRRQYSAKIQCERSKTMFTNYTIATFQDQKLKWQNVVVYKNVSRHCVKHVAMQRYHIAQWHNGLKRSGKAGMPFRTTSVQDDPTCRTTQFNSLLPRQMLVADGLCVSRSTVCHKTVSLHFIQPLQGKVAAKKYSLFYFHLQIRNLVNLHSCLACFPIIVLVKLS